MDLNNIGNLSRSTRSADQQKKTASSNNNFASFSETLEEMRRANQPTAEYEQCGKYGQFGQEEQKADWEKEWDMEQERLQRERKISDRETEQIKKAASYRAAKRMKLLEYARYLKETSIQRSEEERERIAGREEKDIEKKRYRAKTVHVPVPHIVHTGNISEDIFLR